MTLKITYGFEGLGYFNGINWVLLPLLQIRNIYDVAKKEIEYCCPKDLGGGGGIKLNRGQCLKICTENLHI